jgi:aldehyde:ferredoxin oxidoreductase
LKGNEDPLRLENSLVFASGPQQGMKIAGIGRHVVLSISPKIGNLNGLICRWIFYARTWYIGVGGYYYKRQGRLSYIYISIIDGKVAINDVFFLWGMDVGNIDAKLREKYKGARIACIGQAGENLVHFAGIMNDVNRAAGKPGFGAVMGSNNLKAIVVKGGVKKQFYEEKLLAEVKKDL